MAGEVAGLVGEEEEQEEETDVSSADSPDISPVSVPTAVAAGSGEADSSKNYWPLIVLSLIIKIRN